MAKYSEQTLLKACEKALTDTFEGIAFSQVLEHEVLSELPQLEGSEYSAYIDLPEPIMLRFLLVMTKEHAAECFDSVTAGMDVELASRIITDFVRELTNTAAGHFTSILAPEKKDMTIGLPHQPNPSERDEQLTPKDNNLVVSLAVEEYTVLCALNAV